MLTLGYKEVIVNDSSKFPVTVTAPTGTNSLLTIKGLGQFEDTHIVSVVANRYIPSRTGALVFTAPTTAELGITSTEVNVPIKVHIRINTSRYTSEWATDFIKRGRPFIFEILVNGTDTSTVIMNKLVSMFTEYESRFNYANNGLPYTWNQDGDTTTLTLKDPFLSFRNFVEFLRDGYTYGIKAETSQFIDTGATVTPAVVASTTVTVSSSTGLIVGDTILADGVEATITDIISATAVQVSSAVSITDTSILYLEKTNIEPTFDGKYLEENVRMSTPYTRDSYGISPDEYSVISGGYTTITFEAQTISGFGIDNLHKKHAFLGTTRGEIGGDSLFRFTLYFLEGTDLFDTNGKVDDILTFLLTAVPANTKMYIANRNEVTSVADFLANTY